MIEKVIRQYLGWAKKITQHPIFLIEISNFSVLFTLFLEDGRGKCFKEDGKSYDHLFILF